MGFVKAGDLMEYEDGKRKAEDVRELCGRCTLPALFFETEEERHAFFVKIGYLDPIKT